jgi:hypothetical protein
LQRSESTDDPAISVDRDIDAIDVVDGADVVASAGYGVLCRSLIEAKGDTLSKRICLPAPASDDTLAEAHAFCERHRSTPRRCEYGYPAIGGCRRV